MDAQCARGTLGRVTRGENSDVQLAAGVHGRGLAFESWLLAGETYLHVQTCGAPLKLELLRKGAGKMLGCVWRVKHDGRDESAGSRQVQASASRSICEIRHKHEAIGGYVLSRAGSRGC